MGKMWKKHENIQPYMRTLFTSMGRNRFDSPVAAGLVVMATCSSPDEVVQVLFFRIKGEWESYTIYKYLNQGKQPYPYIHATRYDSKSAIVFT